MHTLNTWLHAFAVVCISAILYIYIVVHHPTRKKQSVPHQSGVTVTKRYCNKLYWCCGLGRRIPSWINHSNIKIKYIVYVCIVDWVATYSSRSSRRDKVNRELYLDVAIETMRWIFFCRWWKYIYQMDVQQQQALLLDNSTGTTTGTNSLLLIPLSGIQGYCN